MSVHVHPTGQAVVPPGVPVTVAAAVAVEVAVPVGVGDEPPPVTAAAVKATLLRLVGVWDVTAKPARTWPEKAGRFKLEPGISVHVVPLLEVYVLYVLPARVTLRYRGAPPLVEACCTALAPSPV
jgi:hypothetical protein